MDIDGNGTPEAPMDDFDPAGDSSASPVDSMFSSFAPPDGSQQEQSQIGEHNSQDPPDPARSGRMSGFSHFLPEVEAEMRQDRERAAADTTRANEGRDWPIPARYIRHWERVPDALKNVPIPTSTYFRGPCMVPSQEHRGKMYSTSKCFDMLFQNEVGLLSDPTMGQTFWFVDECMTDLPLHIQKVLYFFDSVKTLMGRDYANYAFPCTDIALVYDRSGNKTVPSLVTNGLINDPDEADQQRRTRNAGGNIRISDVLRERYLDQPEQLKKPVAGITIHVGFTGAVFNVDTKEHRKNYAIAGITCAANVAMWPYIYEKVLVPPKPNSPNFDTLNKTYLEMRFTLNEILRYEAFHNLGVSKDDFGMPEEYIHASGGCLGNLTVLSQFNLPFKIHHRIEAEFPNAADVKIINMPSLTFQWDDELTTDWIRAMHDSITANQRLEARKMEALQRYSSAKEKNLCEDVQLDAPGGWPLDVGVDGTVTAFGLPPLPLMTIFDSHGGRGMFYVWSSGIGPLPDLVSALLRAFIGQNGPLESVPEIGHFLKDRRNANPVLVLKTFFGTDVDPFKSLILTNSHKMLYESLVKDNTERRKKGATVDDIIRSMENYVASCVQTLKSMIMAGTFRSDTIRHKLDIVNSINFQDVCRSIRATVQENRVQMPQCRRYDSFHTMWHSFMKSWEKMNSYFSLNSANLVCAFEVMVSQLMHMFGDTNKTWTFFFATILVMSGNGHFQIHTKEGVVMDTRKPNTTGLDFLIARLTELWTTLYKTTNIPVSERLNILLNCARFTETAWENIVTATATNGMIVTLPEKSLTDRPIAIPELRANSLQAIIQHVCNRGEGANTMSLNSCDMNKTGARTLAEKYKIDNAGICVMASNVGDDTKKQAEESLTLSLVAPSMVPGSGPAPQKKRRCRFNDVSKDIHTGRNQPMEEDKYAYFIAYTHNFAGLLGLVNRLGALPFEVNINVSEFHGWACFYLQQFAGGVMNKTVLDSFDRMKQGYLSRGLVHSIHLKTINALSCSTYSEEETSKKLLLDLHVHPLPVISVPSVLCCMMSRAVNMAALLMTAVVAQHLSVPVISWKSLKRFFEDDVAPTEAGAYMDDFKEIHDFVKDCIQKNRFCADEDGPLNFDENISCYITGDGKVDNTPANIKKGLLRFPFNGKEKTEEDNDLFYKAALKINEEFGAILHRTCHMGKETSSVKCALVQLVSHFTPDFRGILSSSTFHSRKHFAKLGLLAHIPGMKDYDGDESPVFGKQCVFKVGNETRSVGIGFNIWYLLITVSLMRDTTLHPDASNIFSRSLVEEVLSNAPASSTPGGISPIRNFQLHSVQVEQLYTPEENRPEHFLRPVDVSFLTSGVLSVARGYKQFLIEDKMHCSFLDSLATMLCCDILEVPAKAVQSPYELMPRRPYSFHIPNDGDHKYGTVTVHMEAESVSVVFDEFTPVTMNGVSPDEESTVNAVTIKPYDSWEDYLNQQEYVITPMIWRKGACVLVPLNETESMLGCLISYPEFKSQFNHNTCKYQALLDSDNTVTQIFFLDALKWLVPVGEILYLNMDILEEPYKTQGGNGKLLYSRLNVPPMADPEEGKLYVTCMIKKPRTRSIPASLSAVTFSVNPWDVQLATRFTGDPKLVVPHLH